MCQRTKHRCRIKYHSRLDQKLYLTPKSLLEEFSLGKKIHCHSQKVHSSSISSNLEKMKRFRRFSYQRLKK